MLFNSLGYIAFLIIAVILIWVLSSRYRIYGIAAFSLLFYGMWRWEFVSLLLVSSTIDFIAAKLISQSENKTKRKLFLILSLTSNVGLLVFFKYTYFLYENFGSILSILGIVMPDISGLNIILPLGISFYTFQTISYTIDVYRGVSKPTSSFVAFLSYVSFWPQLIAGPVLRANEVLPQLEQIRKIHISDLNIGIQRIITGLFKKVVLADNLAPMVDDIFSRDLSYFNGPDGWVAAILFGFQIYFDFAGYSDIAIGSARLLGIRFPENFNWPYMALTPKDFWGRWHISLSAWIRDYLYLPLTNQPFLTKSTEGISIATSNTATGNKKNYALFLTWFIMGLWHGAGWTFALWGIYHAFFIFLYRITKFAQTGLSKSPYLCWVLTFPICMAGWIPFRAKSLDDAIMLFSKLINPVEYNPINYELNVRYYVFAGVLTLSMVVLYWFKKKILIRVNDSFLIQLVKVLVIALLTFLIIVYLRPTNQFIYFQF